MSKAGLGFWESRPLRARRVGSVGSLAIRPQAARQPTRGSADGQRERRRTGAAQRHSGVMDKGLKKGAIGYVSNIVIGVASTAPGVLARRDARLHRRRQGRRRACAGRTARVVPADAAGRRRPTNTSTAPTRTPGTTFAWTTRAFGPAIGLAQRLGDLPRRRDRDGLAVGHRRDLHVQALRLHRTRRIESRDHHRGDPVDRDHDLDLLARHRAARRAIQRALLSAEVFILGALRGRRAGQGLRRQPAARLDQALGRRGSTRSR